MSIASESTADLGDDSTLANLSSLISVSLLQQLDEEEGGRSLEKSKRSPHRRRSSSEKSPRNSKHKKHKKSKDSKSKSKKSSSRDKKKDKKSKSHSKSSKTKENEQQIPTNICEGLAKYLEERLETEETEQQFDELSKESATIESIPLPEQQPEEGEIVESDAIKSRSSVSVTKEIDNLINDQITKKGLKTAKKKKEKTTKTSKTVSSTVSKKIKVTDDKFNERRTDEPSDERLGEKWRYMGDNFHMFDSRDDDSHGHRRDDRANASRKSPSRKDYDKKPHRTRSRSPHDTRKDHDRRSRSPHRSSRDYDTDRGSRRRSESPDHRYDYRRRREVDRDRLFNEHRSVSQARSIRSVSRARSTRSMSSVRRVYTEHEKIDKAKLLSIARENLSKMVADGTLPKGAQVEKFKLRHLKELSTAQSVHQWTEFCRAISAMEAAAYSDSSLSGSDIDSDEDVRSVISQVTFDGRHPFVLKERKEIQIKVRDFAQLRARSAKEVQCEMSEQFPVSSGNTHRLKALKWTEVIPEVPKAMPPPMALPPKPKKKASTEKTLPTPTFLADKPQEPEAPAEVDPQPSTSSQTIDIGSIMASRISAMRVLEQDPLNVVALKQMHQSNEMMTSWSTSQLMPGQFTGNTGVNLIGPEQLQGARPIWTRMDELKTAIAFDGGIGKHLLKRMGWTEGKGLGKNQDGIVEPIAPSLKFDTKGLRSADENKARNVHQQLVSQPAASSHASGSNALPVNLSNFGVHPVSMLQEHCSRRKLMIPEYVIVESSGPQHKPIYVMKVNVNGVWYQPTICAPTKKQAKALAAAVACQAFNLLPRDAPN